MLVVAICACETDVVERGRLLARFLLTADRADRNLTSFGSAKY